MILKSSQGDDIIIDEEDYNKVKHVKWSVKRSQREGSKTQRVSIRNTKIGMSLGRFLMDCPEDKIVDHINGNAFDNRKENLRICSYSQNGANKKPFGKSGYKGVYIKRNKDGSVYYNICISVNRKYIYLGTTKNLLDGAKLYNDAALKYFGAFAYLNKID